MAENLRALKPPKESAAVKRAADAYQLRVLGWSWDAIAKELGFENRSNAYRAVRTHFVDMPEADKEFMRGMHRETAQSLLRVALEAVKESAGSPASIRAAIDVMKRLSALDGLDEAMRVSISPSDGDLQKFVESVVSLGGKSMPREADIFSEDY